MSISEDQRLTSLVLGNRESDVQASKEKVDVTNVLMVLMMETDKSFFSCTFFSLLVFPSMGLEVDKSRSDQFHLLFK